MNIEVFINSCKGLGKKLINLAPNEIEVTRQNTPPDERSIDAAEQHAEFDSAGIRWEKLAY